MKECDKLYAVCPQLMAPELCLPCRQQREIDRLKEAAKRAKVLLDDATYHDGRYDQHTSPEWQKEACEVSGLLLEPVKEGG
jgi:hypothetical protein